MRTKEKKLTKKEKIRNFRIKTLLVFIALVFAIVLIISAISGRSSKATIKQFINSINKSNQEKFISLIDPEGCQALSECYAYNKSGIEYDFSKFNASYNEKNKNIRKMKKDEKKDYETRKISALENTFGNVKYSFFKNNEILEIKIKSIKTEKMKTNKNITKVVTEVESTSRNGAKAVSSYTFYTLKKGIKDYIISPGMGIQLYF